MASNELFYIMDHSPRLHKTQSTGSTTGSKSRVIIYATTAKTPHLWPAPVKSTQAVKSPSKQSSSISQSLGRTLPMAPSKSVPIPIHRSASHTPSMMVNAKKYLSDRPQLLDCPRCRAHGDTELRFVNGFFTWLAFLIILICGIFVLPLFFLWVPFCVDTFKDVEHHCSSCHAWVGTYRRIGKST